MLLYLILNPHLQTQVLIITDTTNATRSPIQLSLLPTNTVRQISLVAMTRSTLPLPQFQFQSRTASLPAP